jgi:hypothetical protein
MPRIRTLKTEISTFYSEIMVSSEKKEREDDEPEKDEKGVWTTRGGIGNGWHGGLFVDDLLAPTPRLFKPLADTIPEDSFLNFLATRRSASSAR